MFDIRYHLFYLCAIFLMMGFGILIGEAVYPHQAKAQANTLKMLRKEATQAVQISETAQQQFQLTQGAIDALRPALVRNKLAGKRVTILLTGDYPDAAQSAANALTDAGASIAATVTFTDTWSTLSAPASGQALHSLALLLTQGTANSAQNQLERDTLETQGLINVNGELSKPVGLFVLVGGYSDPSADPSAPLDIGLANQIQSASQGSAVIVGCEPLDATVSVMQAYQDDNLPTVDCIDQPLGELDLPFALHGQPDSYGLTSTAARQLPPSLDGSAAP
jgi:hypothetical protein